MTYTYETDFTQIPYPAAGETSSASEEAYRSSIPDWYFEILVKAFADDNGDGTLADSFQVTPGAGLSVSVAAGQGFCKGLVIEKATPTSKGGLTDNATNYLFLKKTATTKRDKSFTVEAAIAAPPMADAIYIATVITAGGVVTEVNNAPSGRAPYLRENPNPQIISDIPGLKVVAPSGGAYTSPKTAIEAASAGDLIYICAGTYALTATITVPANNITIMGASREGVILNNTTGSTQTILDLTGKNGVRIAHLTIQSAAGNGGSAIVTTSCQDLIIDDVRVSSTALARAVNGAGMTRVTISGCRFDGAFAAGGYIIYLGGSDLIITECKITSSGTANGMYINGSRPLVVANRVMITSASFAGIGIWLVDCSHIRCHFNHVEASSPADWYAIAIRNLAAGTVYGGEIIGNHLLSSGGNGRGIGCYTSAGQNLDQTLIGSNVATLFNKGVDIIDSRVRETLVHGNKVATCTTAVSDAGTNTNALDQD